ncbi:hypothetical protein H5410_021374 [Solanum commersonii]|uniref:Uncharacterized protein n=1 Tax=Solanum commersonii TaxID=4109 RepID=A0A9J5ZCF0_SOLCO|nr:hypothetical protein H5410_021374 [Solanum commersonii]
MGLFMDTPNGFSMEKGFPQEIRHIQPMMMKLSTDKTGLVRNKKNPEGAIVEGFSAIECLTFILRYLPDMVKTIFSRYQTEDDEDNQTEEGDASPLFPKTGHPIGSMNKRKGKTFNMEHHEWFEAHRYALFNTGYEKVEAFIKEHKNLIDNRTRENAWVKAQIHNSIENNVYYARNKVPVDLYDLEEENCPNIEETFWRETNDDIGSSERVLDVDVRWSREDLPVDIIDLPALAQYSEDITMETSEEENDFDDTDWYWMEIWIVMSQQESSKRNKREKKIRHAKPGSLSFLANKKRRLLTTNEIVQAIESEKGQLLKLIEQQPVAQQSEANGQSVEEQLLKQQPIEDQVQMNSVTPPTGEQPKEQGVSSKNKRGQTQMHNVHARKERKMILLNRLNQPVGPTEDVVTELSIFPGTLARNVALCPFDIFDWRSMDTKKDLWDYTKEKYIIPEAAKDWALVTILESWRRHKRTRKRKPDHLYKASNENTTSKIVRILSI